MRQRIEGSRVRAAIALFAALAASVVWLSDVAAQPVAAPARVSERSVKAAFLYKFASYVQWPEVAESTTATLTIGVLGANDFARELIEITADRSVSNRPIAIRRLDRNDSLDDVDILFIGTDDEQLLRQYLMAAQTRPILTVTEAPGAIADGSIINFTMDQERVRFEVSLYSAERSQLKLNARLLAVAQQVYREP